MPTNLSFDQPVGFMRGLLWTQLRSTGINQLIFSTYSLLWFILASAMAVRS